MSGRCGHETPYSDFGGLFSNDIDVAGSACATFHKAAPEVSAITSNWHVISSGGTSYSTSGPITLGATIGQSQAGPLNATGYWVQVGFWIEEFLSLYLPIIIK